MKRSHIGLRPYYCMICDRTYDHKKHQLVHSQEKPHQCKTCLMVFSLEGNMRRHEVIHSTERPFSCVQCDDTFKLEDSLKTHVKRIHLKDLSFKCEDCPSKFVTNMELKGHWKRKHMVISQYIPCDECGKHSD